MGGVAEFRGLVATGEEIKGATGIAKWVGSLTGAVKEIDAAEMLVVDEWLAQGRNVVKIAKDPNAVAKTYDFIVDGVKIEAKALKNPNINTGFYTMTVFLSALQCVDIKLKKLNHQSIHFSKRFLPCFYLLQ